MIAASVIQIGMSSMTYWTMHSATDRTTTPVPTHDSGNSVDEILAWRRETMSSTSTMSRSLDLPMMISRFIRSGNSPPWYLPEMKRSA